MTAAQERQAYDEMDSWGATGVQFAPGHLTEENADKAVGIASRLREHYRDGTSPGPLPGFQGGAGMVPARYAQIDFQDPPRWPHEMGDYMAGQGFTRYDAPPPIGRGESYPRAWVDLQTGDVQHNLATGLDGFVGDAYIPENIPTGLGPPREPWRTPPSQRDVTSGQRITEEHQRSALEAIARVLAGR
jgi:hypothetical protein